MGLEFDINKIEELFYLIRDDIFPNVYKSIEDKGYHEKKLIFALHQEVSRDKKIVNKIIEEIDKLNSVLSEDAKFAYESDPSCSSIEEVKLIYPGFNAILSYRIAHIFYQLDFKLIARTISEFAHSKTGIDIHPGASIGYPFFIDHGTGVVIGETSIIGNYVKIYHGVTLGALSLSKGRDMVGYKRHPTIKDNVTIYSSSSILGGDTIIGNNVTIGSFVLVTSSVDDCHLVQGDKNKVKITHKKR